MIGDISTVADTRFFGAVKARARIIKCHGPGVGERQFDGPVAYAILDGTGGGVMVSRADARGESRPALPEHISLVPAGTPIRLEVRQATSFRELVVEIPTRPGLVPACNLPVIDCARLMLADRDMLHAADLIAAECLSARPSDPVYGGGLSIVFLKALWRMAVPGALSHRRGGLAQWQLRRVTDFLEANLANGARIADLALLVNLSPSYFNRAFKSSTGMTPQAWLRAARIRRVQELLMDGGTSLANVAQATGFSDQAHLTRTFGQATGESPGAWRRARQAPSPLRRSPQIALNAAAR